MSELVFIRAYPTRFAAEQAEQYLAQQGVAALVQADDAGNMFAGISLGRKGVRLLVRAEDVEAAREALAAFEAVATGEAGAAGDADDLAGAVAFAEQAIANFDAGDNCAEAVLRTFVAAVGLDAGVVRLATGFGGGLGRRGETCGALSGAVMALNGRFGRLDSADDAAKERCYEVVRALVDRFREACGAVTCQDLIGLDLTTDAGRQRYESEEIRATVCRRCVGAAASSVAELLAHDAYF
ncbi:MAG TPA: C-GCAxxG-C-C family (seleno)protein [Candidatus Krumholzibacteria bacterium]|nr:C-GCAxxG-C-C family (seleno)protein [Candidatus Krumholzibacteria bacterium]HPD71865.1 C-GCAxxG-C-C family (seleno)protein [Candidatus Krumholzibacteria bacterium]HRY41202.1 C-GCAxxG-C-C family (seleno)protein [Candidatus Krumholzibacteria bacterium]